MPKLDLDKIIEFSKLKPNKSYFIESEMDYFNFKEVHEPKGTDLSSWETSMTEPGQHRDDSFRYVVHGVHNTNSLPRLDQKIFLIQYCRDCINKDNDIDLLEEPQRISEKPIISASLIDQAHRATWGNAGYILKVPFDNILKTAREDIGTFYAQGKILVEQLYLEKEKLGIARPETILNSTSKTNYNEIVTTGTGKGGKKVSIEGVFVKVLPDGEYVDQDLATRIMNVALAQNLPIIRIQESFYEYEDIKPEINEEYNWLAIHTNGKRYFFDVDKKRLEVMEMASGDLLIDIIKGGKAKAELVYRPE